MTKYVIFFVWLKNNFSKPLHICSYFTVLKIKQHSCVRNILIHHGLKFAIADWRELGRRTWFMTWITPLVALTSAVVTLAPSTWTLYPRKKNTKRWYIWEWGITLVTVHDFTINIFRHSNFNHFCHVLYMTSWRRTWTMQIHIKFISTYH